MWRIRLFSLLVAFISHSALSGQALHRPLDAEPETLDPPMTYSDEAAAIDRELFVGLLAVDPHGRPIPGVARSWETSPDGLVWTFHLRQDAKWSNGDPVTAEDFVYSFRRFVDPASAVPDTSWLAQVANAKAIVANQEKDVSKLGVVALDPYTLAITLTEGRVTLLDVLSTPTLAPVHRSTVEKWGNAWTRPEHIVSNGPYRLKSWTPQSSIVLEKDPNFFEAASVKIEEVQWLNVADEKVAIRRYQNGELDLVDIDREDLTWVRKQLADQIHAGPISTVRFLCVNMAKGALAQDIRLREALNLAIDRETLVNRVIPFGQKAAYSYVPPTVSNRTLQAMSFKDQTMEERRRAAKALLAEAGYGPDHPLKLTVSYMTSNDSKEVLLAISQMLRPVGIAVALDNMEPQVYWHREAERDYEIGFHGWVGWFDDFEIFFDGFYSGSGDTDFTGYSNPAFDQLYRQAMTEMNPVARRELSEKAERVMLADYPVIPLWFGASNQLVTPKLRGVTINALPDQSRYLSFAEAGP